MAGYYGFTLVVSVSIRLSVYCMSVRPYFHFRMIIEKMSIDLAKLGMCIDIVEICLV